MYNTYNFFSFVYSSYIRVYRLCIICYTYIYTSLIAVHNCICIILSCPRMHKLYCKNTCVYCALHYGYFLHYDVSCNKITRRVSAVYNAYNRERIGRYVKRSNARTTIGASLFSYMSHNRQIKHLLLCTYILPIIIIVFVCVQPGNAYFSFKTVFFFHDRFVSISFFLFLSPYIVV